MELQYAPPAKSPTRVVPVILAGLLTTALTLLGVYLVDKNQSTNIMGSLVRCRSCNSGYLDSKLLTGQGKRLKTTQWNPFHLSPDFIAAYTHPFGAVSRTSVAATGNVRT